MKFDSIVLATAAVVITLSLGVLATPYVLADRVMPGVWLGRHNISGIKKNDLTGMLKVYEKELLARTVNLSLREQEESYSLEQLGFSLDKEATMAAVLETSRNVYIPAFHKINPILRLDDKAARVLLNGSFEEQLSLPKNATLELEANNNFTLIKSESGEQVDIVTFEQDVVRQVTFEENKTIDLIVVNAAANIQDYEVDQARNLASDLLRDGVTLSFEDGTFSMRPFTIRRLLEFVEKDDPENEDNKILGVKFDEEGLEQYLRTTIIPSVNRDPVNARFELKEGKVEQFSVPSDGQSLDIEASIANINSSLYDNMREATLAVEITEPTVKTNEDIEALGVTTLLATGESDFAGSPANRIHNIHVGAARYHGLLIASEEEFSFNEFLGPVTAAAGFKPELVIKGNQTIPEFGGGLCQVSTTIFRAAVHTGLEVTKRRNHSYAVQYYDTPGFDATIYPPYTDLRFLNNTPGYILVQVKITGTKIEFEFWGTDDGRAVEVTKPYIYDRQPNGAMKATVKQTVTRDGQTIIEDTFFSNYRSPDLFPRVLAEDGARPAQAD